MSADYGYRPGQSTAAWLVEVMGGPSESASYWADY